MRTTRLAGITVAKKIADMYCTGIERLCGDEIYFDIEEVLSLQVAFIKRLGGVDIKLYDGRKKSIKK